MKNLSSLKDKSLRYWTYFKRGHGTYLAFLPTFANFVVIQYRLLIENITIHLGNMTVMMYFIATFIIVYIPISTIIGWLDFKKGTVPIESTVGTLTSPWARDIAKSLILIATENRRELKNIT